MKALAGPPSRTLERPAGLLREDLSRKPSHQRFVDAVDAQKGQRLTD